ncbi:SulP family inorganic anion transporter [Pelagibaculum spongiae]|uniref:Sodium-independent anion transporter n=1 Tax=Pelagibaculum spongiae TaxID=2080658 RepID=A0A2V1GWC3_9GAMM|nr:sulfate permease [Pelagibaculum spongiae]PVZ68248.1 sodium-independent anion transporter [Pelagibaculum spongiae]
MSNSHNRWTRWFPWLAWRKSYQQSDLVADLLAGAVVAVLLVPQGMAYAMLAGLPPQMGLYAAILPTLLYSLFGSSRSLAVGPVAIASLMTGEAVLAFAEIGSQQYLQLTVQLSLLTGLFLLLLRMLRMGQVVAFLSHAVISGFTAGAAVLIALNQLSHISGISLAGAHGAAELMMTFWQRLEQLNPTTLMIAGVALLLLVLWKSLLPAGLTRLGMSKTLASMLGKAAPMAAVIFGLLVIGLGDYDQSAGVKIVGAIPAGLPEISVVNIFQTPDNQSIWHNLWILAPSAFLIALVGFLESVSVATALAGKKRETIEPDNELFALAIANLGSAVSGTMPVAGGFGRSMVNDAAGAKTTLASVISAVLLLITLLWFTEWFEQLPKAVLGAVILIAVLPLIDIKSILQTWRYNKADGVTLFTSFVAVLVCGVELGILIGIGCSFVLLVWRVSQPHIARVGRVDATGHYRNLKRYPQAQHQGLLLIRVDESLYFANARVVEDSLMQLALAEGQSGHLVLICSGINFIDASALESLERLQTKLQSAGIVLHLAEVKGPVMDRLAATRFIDHLGQGKVFLSTEQAVDYLTQQLEWTI